MPADQFFQTYLTALRKHPLGVKTEHTDRGALETLLQAVADEHSAATKVQHEPKRAQDKGAPDYKITRTGVMVGYVEAKQIGANLESVLKTDQIKHYLDLNPNLIVTDYLRFIWIKDGKIKDALDARLCEASAIESKLPLNSERIAEVEQLLRGFFQTAPKGVKRASELAEALAVRSKLLRDFLAEELQRQEKEEEGGKLLGLYKAFKEQVSHDLKLDEFADAYAQTLAYGLFLAKLNVKPGEVITLGNAHDHVPAGFSLIRELVEFLKELDRDEYRDIKWVVEEILSIVNHLNVEAIRGDLSFNKRRAYSRGVRARSEEEWRLFSKDPFVYFYEDYLAKYDKAMKKARGVYYTPPPIVNFIVRAINDILKDTFEIEQGLADRERVTVLDFACGTGTFLVEVLERIFDEIGGPESGVAPLIVREHILKNIYGFEYLIAPYTIAHLKLSQYLSELAQRAMNPSIALKKGERFQVFLTNTLDPKEPQGEMFLPSLTKETKEAHKVKQKNILVITGNPPYAGHSKNKAYTEIDAYKYTVEEHENPDNPKGKPIEARVPLGERNPKWLNDDYVKFLRFAQMKMDEVEEGVVGVITNHSWLDNPTFRGMRQSLMRSFNQIYVLDLHGNLKKKEKAADGSKDENVFDIEQGVAISLFIKRSGLDSGVWRGDVWGKRLQKYQASAGGSIASSGLKAVRPRPKDYLFVVQDEVLESAYRTGRPLNDIFPLNGAGMVTAHDDFSIAFDPDELEKRFDKFRASPGDAATLHRDFQVARKQGWDILRGWKALKESSRPTSEFIRPILHLPFDERSILYEDNLVWRTVRRIMDHAKKPNIILLSSRITKDNPTALVSVDAFRHKSGTRYDITYGFPLLGDAGLENFSPEFRRYVDARYSNHYTPEQILGYIYAVLHAPTYRSRYAEFLRIDFPRIPFSESSADFEKLSALGSALVEAHLLRKVKRRGLGKYQGHKQGDDDNRVLDVRYAEAEQAVFINDAQRFAPIPPEVWNFHIGGYQVLEKYLKSRKTRVMTLDEIEHVAKVADVLAFTIEQMAAVDEAYKAAFPQAGAAST
ncbi:MAG TPA: type ISP restriction/modification enzyme [Caulobacterales bacterium]|nr:type ISP restriction/modification enzyme [Caulobacterales bacterium]